MKPFSQETVQPEVAADYRNPTLPIEDRLADLIGKMTLEEKIAQMLCVWGEKRTILSDDEGNLDPDKLVEHYKHGIGQVARVSDTGGGLDARKSAELANALQRVLVEKTRLGIPAVFHEECLHGLAAKGAASYPQPIALATTFRPELVREIYDAIATDTRARGAHQALTPVLDVSRDARWGRVEETFGEDPFLIAEMGVAAVRGFQGGVRLNGQTHIVATLKHFAAHGQPESGMNCGPANFSERLLRDIFFSPFREVLSRANPLSVMASYNEIDGVPSHANRWLLRDVLRAEWGFRGYVVSDYYAITELHRRDDVVSHRVAGDKKEAAGLAVRAGVNIEFPDPDCYPNLAEMVREGMLTEAEIDELIQPLLRAKFLLGLFDVPYVNPDLAESSVRMKQEQALALRAARESIVLLKNDDALLPLARKDLTTIAVIGPNADRELLGGYSGTPPHFVTVLQGIREKVGDGVRVLYSEGCKITVGGSWNEDAVTLPDPEADKASIEDAVRCARQADVVVLAVGGNEQTSREAWSKTHLGDRASLDLVGAQQELVDAVVGTGKPVVVLLFGGRPASIGDIHAQVPAILECWYLGQECGRAVADVLFGDYNPGGKLPISFPRSAGHIPCYYNHKPSARRGYLFDDVTPLYSFGYGLSYTTFQFSKLRAAAPVIRTDEPTTISIDVKNTGTRAGEEVVQMYIRDLVSSVTRPVKELKGFAKILLQPGETKTVTLAVTPEQLAFTTIDNRFTVEPGEFEIMVGNSSRDKDLLTTILRVT